MRRIFAILQVCFLLTAVWAGQPATAADQTAGIARAMQSVVSVLPLWLGLPQGGGPDIPAGAAEGIPAYKTWSFGVGVAAGPDLSEEDAYKIVKAIMEDKSVQGNAMASVKGVNLAELTLQYGTVPLHPGAARWFKENGYDIPAKLMPAS